jgi:hypothetical protein
MIRKVRMKQSQRGMRVTPMRGSRLQNQTTKMTPRKMRTMLNHT